MSSFDLQLRNRIEETIDRRFRNDGSVKDLVTLGKPIHFSFALGADPATSEREFSHALDIFLDEQIYEHPIKIRIDQAAFSLLSEGGSSSDMDIMVPVSKPTRFEIYREVSFWISLFVNGRPTKDRFVEGLDPIVDDRGDQEFHDGIPVYRLIIQ